MEVSGAGQGTFIELLHEDVFTIRMLDIWIGHIGVLGKWRTRNPVQGI